MLEVMMVEVICFSYPVVACEHNNTCRPVLVTQCCKQFSSHNILLYHLFSFSFLCRELGQATSNHSSYEVFVNTTFSIYKMKDIIVAIYQTVDGMKNSDFLQQQQKQIQKQQHLLGYTRFSLHKLVRASEQTCALESGGSVSIVAKPTDTRSKNLRFLFTAGKGLGTKKSLGVQTRHIFEHNPFVALSYYRNEKDVDEKGTSTNGTTKKSGNDGKWEVLWKSDVVHGSTDAQIHFNYGQIPTHRLRNDTPMCITCLDYDYKVSSCCIDIYIYIYIYIYNH